jgi:EmrB/QacA subfamily drug resistance transporter
MKFMQRKRATLLAVAIGTFMSAFDGSVVNLVLPNISAYFHTSLSLVEWTVMSYLLVISSLLLAYGRLGDMFGHKKIYTTGLMIFTAGSFLCGIAGSVIILIIFRALQAIGAGMLMAMGPAIVTDTVAPQNRGKALSVTAVAVAVALTLGPAIGGFLTFLLGWQSIFYVNIPIGIGAYFFARQTIHQKDERINQPFDWMGAGLIFAALICILLSLSLVEVLGWTNLWNILTMIVGLGLAIAFAFWENTAKYPLFNIEFFKNRLFAMSNLSALFNYMAQNTIILLIPFYLQTLRGLGPNQAGLLYLPMPLTTMAIAPVSGVLSDRMDSRYISSSGMAVMAVGMWLLSRLKADSPYMVMIIGLIVVGLGIGLFQTPNNSAIMGAVPRNKSGVASGMLATMRNIGMVMGVGLSGAIFTSCQSWLTLSLKSEGLSGRILFKKAFEGALHITYLMGVGIACVAVITSLVRGSTRKNRG